MKIYIINFLILYIISYNRVSTYLLVEHYGSSSSLGTRLLIFGLGSPCGHRLST